MQVVLVQGTVKFFNDEKGYGFITPDGEAKDVFVHFSQIVSNQPGRRSLVNGARVEFELGEGRKGPEAQQVRSV